MRWWKRSVVAVAGVAVLGLAAWLGVPPLVKWQLESRLSALTGRAVTVDAVRFRPWNLALTLEGFTVAGAAPAGGDPLLQVASVRVNLSLSSLFRLAPVIEELVVSRPQVRLARIAPGRYDIDDVLQRFEPSPSAAEASGPARFAFYNVQVEAGALRFEDRPAQRVHLVEQLSLTLPFLSSMPAQVDVKVEPRLAFRLNGAAFDSGAQTTPFAQTRQGELKLDVRSLDIEPYRAYLPQALPVRPARGKLSAEVGLKFVLPSGGAPSVVLQGRVGATDAAFVDAAGQPLLAWRQLDLQLVDVQPFVRRVALGALRIDGARVTAIRDSARRLNLQQAFAGPAPRQAPPAAASSAASVPRTTAEPEWQMSLQSLVLTDAGVAWRDESVTPASALRLAAIGLEARDLRWPPSAPTPVRITATLHEGAAPDAPAGTLTAEGKVHPSEVALALVLKDLSLHALQPYVAQAFVPNVEGRVSAAARIDWSSRADAPRLAVMLDTASVDALKVALPARRGARPPVPQASLVRLDVSGLQVDALARTVTAVNVAIMRPVVGLVREETGTFNVLQWLKAEAARPQSPVAPSPPAAQAGPAWRMQLATLAIDDGTVRVDDAQAMGAPVRGPAVNAQIQQLRVRLQDLSWHGGRAVPPAKLQFRAVVRGPASEGAGSKGAGLVDVTADLGLQPLLLSGKARIDRFPVHRFAPYAADAAPVRLERGEFSYDGKLSLRQLPAGLEASVGGDMLLGDVRVATLQRGDPARESLSGDPDDLFSWQSLALRRLNVVIKPGARPRIDIGEAALNQFYSRLVVTEDGRFNFEAPPVAAAAAASGVEPAAAPASAVVSRPAEAPTVDFSIGGTRLSNGSIDFSDRLVRPNYSAALTELHGEIGAFRSDSREMAAISLRGRAAGTALLDIRGTLNPAVKPLALDIQAKATDLELAPLSPYAGKYAGYAIERGKLSLEVAYRIDADGTLDARNRVVLNQLTFGDRIESPTATQLPVRLAVALMKDRNGVIDIDLPVSGSLNDPQFSIGGVVWRLIGNLLVKVVTSPFSMLSGGGTEDLSQVAFVPGTAMLSTEGQAAVDKVAKALADKPALKLTVTGAAGPQSEQIAFQRAAIEARLVADQRREANAFASPSAASGVAAPAPRALAPAERTRLLKSLYERSKLPDKPRNALGLARTLPDGEMEALLRQLVPTHEETWRHLAVQRGVAVRDALIAKGFPSERLFLSAPKLHAATGDAAWVPAAQLTLAEQ